MRGNKPFVMTDLRKQHGLAEVIAFITREGLLNHSAADLQHEAYSASLP